MAKLIAFDQEAREGIQRGVDTLADAVKVTLGPVSYTHLTLPTTPYV
mgnify:CR=1